MVIKQKHEFHWSGFLILVFIPVRLLKSNLAVSIVVQYKDGFFRQLGGE